MKRLLQQIWIPQPLYRALPCVAGLVGFAGIQAAGKSVGMLVIACPVMTYGLLVLVVRMSWGGLSNGCC